MLHCVVTCRSTARRVGAVKEIDVTVTVTYSLQHGVYSVLTQWLSWRRLGCFREMLPVTGRGRRKGPLTDDPKMGATCGCNLSGLQRGLVKRNSHAMPLIGLPQLFAIISTSLARDTWQPAAAW